MTLRADEQFQLLVEGFLKPAPGTGIVHRIDDPNGPSNPACVDACNAEGHKAMWFGDLKDPDSEISKRLKLYGGEQIRSDLNLNTGVRYQNLT